MGATPADVASFLSDYGVAAEQVAMEIAHNGAPTGGAFVTLGDEQIAERIRQERHGYEIAGTNILVEKSKYAAWWQAFEGKPVTQDFGAAKGFKGGQPGPYQGGGKGTGLGGMPDESTGDPNKDWLVNQVKEVQRKGDQDKEKWWTYCDKRQSGSRDPKLHSKEFLQEFLDAYAAGTWNDAPTGGPGAGSRILRLRGIPFQCGIPDVMAFLTEYGVDESQIVMGINNQGRPSGESYVAFASEEYAAHALQSKQRGLIGTRYVELFTASYDEFTMANERVQSIGRGGMNQGGGMNQAF